MFDRFFRRPSSSFKLQVNSPELSFTASANDSLLQTALNHGLAFPHNCRVGGCGECKCKLVSGQVKELTDKSYLLSADELRQNYILACQSLPRSDLRIEVALRAGVTQHPLVTTRARILSVAPLTHDVVHLRLAPQAPLRYSAGQYAAFAIPDDVAGASAQGRSYSFASSPRDEAPSPELDFYIRKVPGGIFTEWLFTQAAPGQILDLSGPYGDFGLRPGSGPIVCIAGGSGLAPIKAMLEHAIADKQAQRALTLLFGARNQRDLYALDAIDQIRRNWSGRFEFIPILSDEPADSAWPGRRGLIPTHVPAILGTHLADHQAYLCGPPPMIDACVDVLTHHGLARDQIFFDKFLDSSHAACTRQAESVLI